MIKVCRDIRKTVLYAFDISVIWEVNMILGPNFPYKPFFGVWPTEYESERARDVNENYINISISIAIGKDLTETV